MIIIFLDDNCSVGIEDIEKCQSTIVVDLAPALSENSAQIPLGWIVIWLQKEFLFKSLTHLLQENFVLKMRLECCPRYYKYLEDNTIEKYGDKTTLVNRHHDPPAHLTY